MNKVTDDQIVSVIWTTILKELPRHAVHHYVGGRFGLCRDDEYWAKCCTELSTIWRKKWMCGLLSESQSLRRIKKLADSGRIQRDRRHRSGSCFHIWLDGNMSARAFKRCRQLLLEHGLSETPSDVVNVESIQARVAEALVDEFAEALPC